MSRLSPLPLCLLLLAALVVVVPACGKRGPPLPPLRPAPDKVTSIAVLRHDDDVTISFLTPVRNVDGSLPLEFDRIELYALTAQAGTLTPTVKKVFVLQNRIAVLGERPPALPSSSTDAPPDPDEPPVAVPLSFTEKVASAAQRITLAPLPIAVGQIPGLVAPAAAPVAAASVFLPSTTRFYLIVPYANRTRIGSTDMFGVPLLPAPPAPKNAKITYDENTLTLSWVPGVTGQTVQVYDATPPVAPTVTTATTTPVANAPATASKTPVVVKPLNVAPLAALEFKRPVVFGTEICFIVRGVTGTPPLLFESAPSNVICEKPEDKFPPAPPSGLVAFATEGAIALTWDGVTATDLAGYIVLRSDGTSETLQPLFAAPVTGTSFTDTTARAGVRYTYAVVAVDSAKPANRSKESNRVDETGR